MLVFDILNMKLCSIVLCNKMNTTCRQIFFFPSVNWGQSRRKIPQDRENASQEVKKKKSNKAIKKKIVSSFFTMLPNFMFQLSNAFSLAGTSSYVRLVRGHAASAQGNTATEARTKYARIWHICPAMPCSWAVGLVPVGYPGPTGTYPDFTLGGARTRPPGSLDFPGTQNG